MLKCDIFCAIEKRLMAKRMLKIYSFFFKTTGEKYFLSRCGRKCLKRTTGDPFPMEKNTV